MKLIGMSGKKNILVSQRSLTGVVQLVKKNFKRSNLWNFVKNCNDISGLYNKPIKSTEELWQAFNMADYTFDDLLEELNNEANKKDATEKWLHTVAIECNKIVARYVNESSPKARKGNEEQNIFTIRNSFASNQHRAISAFMKQL